MNRIRALLKAQVSSGAGDDAKAAADLVAQVKQVCQAVHGEDLARCVEMSRIGADWFWKQRRGEGKEGKGLKILTVCNTGSLATSVRSSPLYAPLGNEELID